MVCDVHAVPRSIRNTMCMPSCVWAFVLVGNMEGEKEDNNNDLVPHLV